MKINFLLFFSLSISLILLLLSLQSFLWEDYTVLILLLFILNFLSLLILNKNKIKNFLEKNNLYSKTINRLYLSAIIFALINFCFIFFKKNYNLFLAQNTFLILSLLSFTSAEIIQIKKKQKTPQVLIIVLFLASILRLWRLGNHNFWIDEIWHTYASFIGHQEGSFFASVLNYNKSDAVNFFVYLFDYIPHIPPEIKLRLSFAFLGILFVYIAYLTGKELKNKKLGLYFAFLSALSPEMILQSQNIRFYTLINISLLLIILNYLKFKKNPQKKYIYRLIFFIILSFQHIPFYLLLILPFLFLDFLYQYRHRLSLGSISKNKKFAFLIFLVFIFAIFLFVFYKKFFWIFQKEKIHSNFYYLKNIFIYEFLFIPFFLSAVFLYWKKYFYLLSFFLFSFFLLSFSPLQYPKYYFFLLPLFYFFVALGWENFNNFFKNKTKFAQKLFLVFSLLLPVYNLSQFNLYNNFISLEEKNKQLSQANKISNLSQYFDNKFFTLSRAPLLIKADYNKALQYIYKKEKNSNIFIIADSTQSLKYYNKINNFNFKIIPPWTNKEKLEKILNNNTKIYALVGMRIKLDQKKQCNDDLKKIIFKKMTKIKDFNGLEVWMLKQ